MPHPLGISIMALAGSSGISGDKNPAAICSPPSSWAGETLHPA